MLKIKRKLKRVRKTKTKSRNLFKSLRLATKIKIIVLILTGALLTGMSTKIKPPPQHDDRPDRINTYFTTQKAPLTGFGQIFVETADGCDMDWRLLPAIAMQESTGGKRMQYNNPFGWGGAQIPFESIDEAIIEVGKNLCGHNTSTSKWYSTTSTYEKLYWYNGTASPSYPDEVMWIMDQI
ncbi:MAG: hypothetical protein ABII02_04360 [Candidatus Magasanikbacteria bacterium]